MQELPWGVGAAFAQGPDIPSVGPPGVFFACRTRDGERHWRYVSNDNEITLTPPAILRRIKPGRTPGISDPPVDLEEAWTLAVTSIIQERREDARHFAGRSLGAVQQWARKLLGQPDASSLPAARAAYDALEIERGGQVRQALVRIRRDLADQTLNPDEAARQIIDLVEFYGLREIDPSAPPPEITEEDIGVVCWMAVLPPQREKSD